MQKLWLALLSALLGIAPAQAQNFTMPPPAGVTVGGFVVVPTCAAQSLAATQGFGTMDETGALCVNATVMATATIAGFPTVQSTGTPISVSTVSATGTLPSGTVVVASNVGATNGAYCKLGASATTSDQLIPPNSWFAFTVGANTQLSCITSTSTTTVNMVGGSGIATGSGGGGGGGGGGVVTQPTASLLNATVVGTGTFATQSAVTQTTSPWVVAGNVASGSPLAGNPVRIGISDGTNVQNVLAGIALADGVNGNNQVAVTSWLFNGTTWDRVSGTTKGAYGIIRDAAGNARGANVNSSNELAVTCGNCSGSGVSVVDAAAWTAGMSVFVPSGGVFNDSATLTTGQEGTARLTTKRAQIIDVDTTGNALYSAITGPIPAGTNIIGNVRIDQTTPGTTNGVSVTNANANGQVAMSASSPVVLANNQTAADPCMFQAKTNVPISTSSGTTALVTGVSAKKIYVCSLALIANTPAVSVSLSEGSSSTCGTSSQAAVMGVATSGTASLGIPLAVNGGLTLGNGGGTVAATATAANYLCLFQSGTTLIAGNLTFVQQ
jgi:hypothetical protein